MMNLIATLLLLFSAPLLAMDSSAPELGCKRLMGVSLYQKTPKDSEYFLVSRNVQPFIEGNQLRSLPSFLHGSQDLIFVREKIPLKIHAGLVDSDSLFLDQVLLVSEEVLLKMIRELHYQKGAYRYYGFHVKAGKSESLFCLRGILKEAASVDIKRPLRFDFHDYNLMAMNDFWYIKQCTESVDHHEVHPLAEINTLPEIKRTLSFYHIQEPKFGLITNKAYIRFDNALFIPHGFTSYRTLHIRIIRQVDVPNLMVAVFEKLWVMAKMFISVDFAIRQEGEVMVSFCSHQDIPEDTIHAIHKFFTVYTGDTFFRCELGSNPAKMVDHAIVLVGLEMRWYPFFNDKGSVCWSCGACTLAPFDIFVYRLRALSKEFTRGNRVGMVKIDVRSRPAQPFAAETSFAFKSDLSQDKAKLLIARLFEWGQSMENPLMHCISELNAIYRKGFAIFEIRFSSQLFQAKYLQEILQNELTLVLKRMFGLRFNYPLILIPNHRWHSATELLKMFEEKVVPEPAAPIEPPAQMALLKPVQRSSQKEAHPEKAAAVESDFSLLDLEFPEEQPLSLDFNMVKLVLVPDSTAMEVVETILIQNDTQFECALNQVISNLNGKKKRYSSLILKQTVDLDPVGWISLLFTVGGTYDDLRTVLHSIGFALLWDEFQDHSVSIGASPVYSDGKLTHFRIDCNSSNMADLVPIARSILLIAQKNPFFAGAVESDKCPKSIDAQQGRAMVQCYSFIEASDDLPLYFICTTWPENFSGPDTITGFTVECTDFRNTWTTEVDESYLRMMKPGGMADDMFAKLTFAAFNKGIKGEEGLGTPFLTGTKTNDEVQLYWKLKQKEGFQVILGSCKLRKDNKTHPTTNLQSLITAQSQGASRSAEIDAEMIESAGKIAQLQSELEHTKVAHAAWEKQVFTRFKDVLNAKKRKIRELMQAKQVIVRAHQEATTDNEDEETELDSAEE